MPESREPKRPRARKPAARKTTSTRKTTAPRRPAPRRRLVVERDDELLDARNEAGDEVAETDEVSEDRSDEPSRPVAIGGPTSTAWTDLPGESGMPPSPFDEDPGAPAAPAAEERPRIDDPRGEMLVGVAALALAVSVFLPWYESASLAIGSVSGWASGTWGPIVFFLAVAALAIVGLRRLGVAVAFPVSHALVLEGIGWVSVVFMLLKRFRTPTGFEPAGPIDGGYWLAIVASVGVALLASRLSKDAPFLTIPGWFAGRAGKIGAGILAFSLIAGVAFAFTTDFGSAARPNFGSAGGNDEVPQLQQGLPSCITDSGFPVPEGVQPSQGYGNDEQNICTAIFTSDRSVKQLDKAYRAALKQADWGFQVLKGAAGGSENARVYSITAPECGTLQILNTEQSRSISVVIGPDFCQSALTPDAPPAD